MKPRLKPHYELVPSRRWVVVWQGESPEDKARTRTTWQIPVGATWSNLRQKLRDGVWPERGQVTLTPQECMALRDLVNQYECLLSTPNWRRKEIAKALSEAIGEGECDYCQGTGKYQIDGVENDCECCTDNP
jgi:hypothetical protein